MLDFPSHPNVGDVFLNRWKWDGDAWTSYPEVGGGTRVYVGATAPPYPAGGDMWLREPDNQLAIWNGTSWIDVGGGSAHVGDEAPDDPWIGDMWLREPDNQLAVWNGTSWIDVGGSAGGGDGAKVPIHFVITGMPPAGQVYNVPITLDTVIPPVLSGSHFYSSTSATNAEFVLNKISDGETTEIGRIHSGGGFTVLIGSGGELEAGDVLQLVAPDPQDATLADVGITVLGTS